ncbi:MAG: hypothetical protein WAN93_11405 [Solirubrobacteraceae bacterium]
MSADLPPLERRGTVGAVRVQVVFHVVDDQQAQAVAARMVERAHEIANLPEYECDVDVSIERTQPPAVMNRLDSSHAPRGRSATN